MRSIISAVLATAAIFAAVPASAPAHKGCHTQKCQQRVYTKHRLRVISPYRPWLHRVGQCETGGWSLKSGIRDRSYYRGRYQFSFETWHNAGGYGDPADASWLEQAYRAVKWRQRIGNPHQTMGWPVCG
jgi:hypothetical protein